jgi:hypothetical protein
VGDCGNRSNVVLTVVLALLLTRSSYRCTTGRAVRFAEASGQRPILSQSIEVRGSEPARLLEITLKKRTTEPAQYHSGYFRLLYATGLRVRGTQRGDGDSTRGLHQQKNNEIEQAATTHQ